MVCWKISRPNQCCVHRIDNPIGLKLLTGLRVGLSHLNGINPLCSCNLEIDSTWHMLLHCHHFSNIRSTFLSSINNILGSISNLDGYTLGKNCTLEENSYIVTAIIKYLVDSGRLDGSLLQLWFKFLECIYESLLFLN